MRPASAPGKALHELLERQAYRLAYWRVAADEINYRRFFDINDLAALRMENAEVFDATHALTLDLAARGLIDGIRIDHSDGMLDPAEYFARLQRGYARRLDIELPGPEGGRPARPLYVVVEKIAAGHERVPETWAVHGTTGYRFAAVVDGLFVDGDARARIDRIWRVFTGESGDFGEIAYQGKRMIMRSALASELTVLSTELLRIARADRRTRDYTFNTLRRALEEVAACMPVYRTYITGRPSAQDRRYVDWAVARAMRSSRAADTTIFAFVRQTLLARAMSGASPELRRPRAALRDAVPAVHLAGDRQGGRGHRVLPLQSAGVAQRGRLRPRDVRHERERVPRRQRRPGSRPGRTRCSRARRTTTSARRTCARAST